MEYSNNLNKCKLLLLTGCSTRKRNRNLFIVEGNHEKDEMINILLKLYPQIDIEMEDIVIYHTNIYQLYNEIVKEYDMEWDKNDVDLPLIVGRKIKFLPDMSKDNFKNILIVFDYERHDTHFRKKKLIVYSLIFMIQQTKENCI